MDIKVVIANVSHTGYAEQICVEMEAAAKIRGTGIAKRSPEYVAKKMEEGKSVIALDGQDLVGFCYLETWGHDKFVANSGLIVLDKYRKFGMARQIKSKIFELSRKKYPDAKIFGITTSLAVMKINSELGYMPVTFSELTDDDAFWGGCKSCVNYDILTRNKRKMCLCTGMLYDPAKKKKFDFLDKLKVLDRLKNIKQTFLENRDKKPDLMVMKFFSFFSKRSQVASKA